MSINWRMLVRELGESVHQVFPRTAEGIGVGIHTIFDTQEAAYLIIDFLPASNEEAPSVRAVRLYSQTHLSCSGVAYVFSMGKVRKCVERERKQRDRAYAAVMLTNNELSIEWIKGATEFEEAAEKCNQLSNAPYSEVLWIATRDELETARDRINKMLKEV